MPSNVVLDVFQNTVLLGVYYLLNTEQNEYTAVLSGRLGAQNLIGRLNFTAHRRWRQWIFSCA